MKRLPEETAKTVCIQTPSGFAVICDAAFGYDAD
jgi:hypothetical protein